MILEEPEEIGTNDSLDFVTPLLILEEVDINDSLEFVDSCVTLKGMEEAKTGDPLESTESLLMQEKIEVTETDDSIECVESVLILGKTETDTPLVTQGEMKTTEPDGSNDHLPFTEQAKSQEKMKKGDLSTAFPYQLYVKQVEGSWLDNTLGYTTFGMFAAIPGYSLKSLTPFINAQGHIFNNGRTAVNSGCGVRYSVKPSRCLGVNLFYDYREGRWHHSYQQIGMGFEALGFFLDFRMNGYLPFGKCKARAPIVEYKFDQYVSTCQARQQALPGLDIECGKRFRKWTPSSPYDFYAALGSYYFHVKDFSSPAWGAQFRMLSRLGKYVTLELKTGYDPFYQVSCQGSIRFTLPLNKPKDHSLCCSKRNPWANQPIERQEIIVLQSKPCLWTWNWD